MGSNPTPSAGRKLGLLDALPAFAVGALRCEADLVWLAYLDESGNTGHRLDDPDQPIHYLVAVLVPEEHVLSLASDLQAIAARTCPGNPTAELHGAQLFGGDGDWRGIPVTNRVQAYKEALALIGRYGCVVAHSSIDKRRLWSDSTVATTPHLLALQFLVERLDVFLVSQSDSSAQRALLVADETNEHEAYAINLVADLQSGGVGVVDGRRVERIVDTVHFVRSRDNRGVQLADLVAYALNRVRRKTREAKARQVTLSRGDQALDQMLSVHVNPHIGTYRDTWPRASG